MNGEFQFESETRFEPTADFEAFLKSTPAKWVVYLMRDESDRPFQLLCVKNLRSSLRRRLSGELDAQVLPSRRVNYREIVRAVSWTRVDSAFEADAIYLQAARHFFPQTYRGMIGMREAWFVHVNPDSEFPRYTKTTDLSIQTGTLFGPIEDRNDASQLVEDIEDWFDLCRYYHILVQAPRGLPCAYKEMGKCPAPCDGSISMPQYRQMIEWSTQVLTNPRELVEQQIARMRAAATELRFEAAGKIKQHVDQISSIGKGARAHLRPLHDFRYLAIQRGSRAKFVKAFLISPGAIELLGDFPIDSSTSPELLRIAREHRAASGVDAEKVGIVTHHLFHPKSSQGSILWLGSLDETAIARALQELSRQKEPEASDDEGVVKELGSDR